jgi:type IV pilus assembly protein PilA
MNKNYKGFSLIELLIVVAIILVVAALAILNLLRAKIAANQSSAVGSLRARSSVQAAFQSTYNDGYATSLARLHGAGVTCAAPGLIDPILAAGAKSSYSERYTNDGVVVGVAFVLSGCAAWGSTGFNSGNNPLSVTTGTNHYCIDETGCFVKVQRLWRHRARLRAGFAPVGRTLGDRRECGTTPLNLRAARSRIHEIEKAISNAGVSPVSMKGGKEWAKESNMDYMRFPAWEKPLREARSETDLVKRAEKVAETELAMWSRLQKLNNWPDACAETEAIWEACQEVWRMKSEILRWPDW